MAMPCAFVIACIPLITTFTPETGLPWLLATFMETVTLLLAIVLYAVETTIDVPPDAMTVVVTVEPIEDPPNDENLSIVESGVL